MYIFNTLDYYQKNKKKKFLPISLLEQENKERKSSAENLQKFLSPS
jgi:hypothetical protein